MRRTTYSTEYKALRKNYGILRTQRQRREGLLSRAAAESLSFTVRNDGNG